MGYLTTVCSPLAASRRKSLRTPRRGLFEAEGPAGVPGPGDGVPLAPGIPEESRGHALTRGCELPKGKRGWWFLEGARFFGGFEETPFWGKALKHGIPK